MSLRLKVFLILGGVMVALFFGINALLSRIIMDDFRVLERQEMEEDISRITDGLRSRMDDLSIKLADWAQWDDTYQFIADQNEEFVASNLYDETFGVLRIDFIMIVDGSGSIIYQRHVENGEEKPFPEDFERHITEEIPELFESGLERREEIISLSGETIVYAARPITSSDGTAKPNGYMVFGYRFDQEDADALGRTAHLSVRYEALTGERSLPDDFAQADSQLSREHPILVPDAGSDHAVHGYALVEGGHGKPAAIFRVDTGRDIYHKGQENVALFGKLMGASSVIFAVIIFLILYWLVLKRVARISDQIKNIRESGDSEASIMLSGKDEFAGLAKEVNAMLESMRENEKRVQQQVDEAEKMNRLMVNRELKMIELKQEIRDMKKQIDEQQKKV